MPGRTRYGRVPFSLSSAIALLREVTMEPILGTVPSLLLPPPGGRYADRCPRVRDVCRHDRPPSRAAAPDHEVACHAAEVQHAAARG
jgi:oligopeptide/dipeptide ABC transporter ATP-binding protein